ncbi:SDR family NAD(P)-dependent oxidoreductase [Streptomyces tendae]|uniref:SDR family NAD(P)-dependent oxidoreductase n=1 Tax=Streptomyces tendae TaxID=1932 RepID=UPI00379FE767
MSLALITETSIPSVSGLSAGTGVFVSGAGCGIGAAAARLFAREDARVLLAARTEGGLSTVAEQVQAAGGAGEWMVCDPAGAARVRAAVARTVEVYGCLNAACNNGALATRSRADGRSE